MSSRERMTLAVALAVALAASALAPLYDDLAWLPRTLGAVGVVMLSGLLLRRVNAPAGLQPLMAVLALAAYTCMAFARETLAWGLLPTAATLQQLRVLAGEGLLAVDQLAPPVPTEPGLVLLAVVGVGGIAIVVDVIAVLFARAAVSGLPMLALFAVPSAVLPGGLGSLPFALGAAGWLALLLVEGSDRVSRWGVPLSGRPGDDSPYDEQASLGRVGRRIGAAALGVAVVVPALVPGLDTRLLAGDGDGSGFGSGGSRSRVTVNPITELRGQLNQPTPRQVITYRTDDPSPDYIRLTTLDQFDGSAWSSSALTGTPERNSVEDGLPKPVGQDLTRSRIVSTELSLSGLRTPYLPVPFTPQRVDVDGPWLYHAPSGTVYSSRTDTSRVRSSYRVVAARAEADPEMLAATGAPSARPDEISPYAAVPNRTSRLVTKVMTDVTAPYVSAYEKVAALQRYFLDGRNGFRYSHTTGAALSTVGSPDALDDFLTFKQGFCEQYASAMAAMVRTLGIPARVGVGFTAGTPRGDGTWVVTTSDAHAWPEVWFDGAGWIRFEPTPRRDGQVEVPEYSVAPTGGAVDSPGSATAPQPSAAPQAQQDPEGIDAKRERLDAEDTAAAPPAPPAPADDAGGPQLPPLRWLVAALLAVLAVLPVTLHALRRRQRWRSPSPLSAWAQLRDDAADLGHYWRPSHSPRAAAAHLAASRPLGPAADALHRVASAVERARYARPDAAGLPTGLAADVAEVRRALLAAARPAQRVQALLLPRSTVAWALGGVAGRVADALDAVDEALAGLGRLGRRRGIRSA